MGTDPIPAKAYYDPEWFELERKRCFQPTAVHGMSSPTRLAG